MKKIYKQNKNLLNTKKILIRKDYYKNPILDSLLDYSLLKQLKEFNKKNGNNINNNNDNIFINIIKINKLQNNYKKFLLSMQYHIIILLWNFIFFILINPIITEKILKENRKLQNGQIINLKVRGTEKVKIVNSKFIPTSVYVNGVKSGISKGVVNIENDVINNITLEFTEKKKNLDKFFQDIQSIIEVDLSNYDTTGVTSMKSMFIGCTNLEYINFSNVITSSVTNMTSMFEECRSLTSLDLSSFNTGKVIYMDNMFKNCFSLTSLNLTSFRPKLKKIKEMFSGCESLTNLLIPNIDTSLITTMENLFYDCLSLTSIDINNFNTNKLTIMRGMFSFCESLKLLDLSKIVTSNVKNMNYLFFGCKNLISIYLSNFDTSNVEDFGSMFCECTSLKYIDLSNFDTTIGYNLESMFKDCTSLTSIDLSNFNFESKNMGYFFYNCVSLKTIIFPKKKEIVYNIQNMFYNCKSLVSLDLSCFDFQFIENMDYLFCNCISLTSLDLSNMDATYAMTMDYMFSECISLKTINFTNFFVSSVESIKSMFLDCFSLISLDLSSFDTSWVWDMSSTFSNCKNLTFLDISNFDTSSVYDMNSMFFNCIYLKSLDLSSFNTFNVENMDKMFYGCTNLTSLDLSSFDTEEIENINSMFYGCINLKYINFYNYNVKNTSDQHDIFYGTDNNLVICINEESSESIISELSFEQCIINDCSIDFKNKSIKIIYSNRICLEDCNSDEINKYYFNSFCYDKCPKWTHSNEENEYLCEYNIFECLEVHPFLMLKDNSCTEECNCKDFFTNICKLNNNNVQSQSILISSIIRGIQEGLIDDFLEDLINNERNDIIKIENNTIYQVTTSFNQNNKEYQNISSIKLGECEKILKEKYDILENEILLIFKTEKYIDGILIPIIEYEVFNSKTKEKLNLDYCRNESINIDIYLPISLNEDILYKYDPNNSYYNDICCLSNNENETDISIYDRKNVFNNNFSLCQNNCVYNGYDSLNEKVICQCEVQERKVLSEINKENLLYKFTNNKKITNFHILKCYKLVFSKIGFGKNAGNYIILLIIVLYLVSAIYFYFKGYNKIIHQINYILNEKFNENNQEYFQAIKEMFTNNSNGIFFSLKNGRLSSIKNFRFSKIEMKSKNDSENCINKSILNDQTIRNSIKNKNNKKINEYLDYEMNIISYNEALQKDKRTYLQFYISLIKHKHFLLFSFYPKKDYNAYIIKVCLFFFSFALYLVINTLFFNDTIMHRIYMDKGVYNFKFNLPKIIYSIIIIDIICIILKKLFLTQQNILEIKYEKNHYCLKGKVLTVIKVLIIKSVCFFLFSIIFLFLFWYYLSCFCVIYYNTQLYIIKNTLISFFISLIYPFIFYLLPGIFRYSALRKPGECLYKISQIMQII